MLGKFVKFAPEVRNYRISTIRSIIEEFKKETLKQNFIVASEKGVRIRS